MVGGTESTGRQRDGLQGKFAVAVSSLTGGDLGFPPPFDLSSSAALADNIDEGPIAQQLFDVTAQRQVSYTVVITGRSLQHPEMPEREVMNTTVPSERVLIALLEGFLNELYERQETSRKDT